MRRALGLRELWVASWLLGVAACSPASTDCTCAVALNNERRTLACGESACLAGTSVSCVEKDRSVQRGACSAAPPPVSDAGVSSQPPAPTPDRSCDDLRTFCSVSCSAPAAASAACQATASAGDASACASFQLASGASCHP